MYVLKPFYMSVAEHQNALNTIRIDVYKLLVYYLGDSVVKFGPQAFLEPFTYLDEKEEPSSYILYQNILGGSEANTVFKVKKLL